MTGPEHYREAERLANKANHYTYGDGADPVTGNALATEALVHAILAVAAATVAYPADIETSAASQWADILWPDDHPHDGATIEDSMSASELYELDRDAEFAMDAADDEAHAAIEADEQAEDYR